MEVRGISGRSAVDYGSNPADIVKGVSVYDPPTIPEEGWNKRKWVNTPFGLKTYSGIYIPIKEWTLTEDDKND